MSITNVIFYILAFLSLYVQVFFFVTFLESKKKLVFRKKGWKLKEYPSVAIIVPCWNEEKTIEGTIKSLIDLNYPKEKLEIILVDDGSTDATFSIMQKYKDISNIQIIKKENGGKHTATNLGIKKTTAPFIGCLDADSFVHKEALVRMLSYFEAHPETMAVSPSIVIYNPKTFIQKLQKVEYDWAIFIKKMLGIVGGIHVTPGPLSIYRREVFEKIGLFRKAHNTEDMEIAFRMQINHLRIRQCNDAYIYTVGPKTISALYKQRLRWIFGFIQNTIDYRKYMFKSKFGVFALFTVPSGFVSLIAAPFLLYLVILRMAKFAIEKANYTSVFGPKELFNISHESFSMDWFSIPSTPIIYITLVLYIFVIVGIFIGRSMDKTEDKKSWPIYQIIPFFITYSFIAPFWILKALWRSIIRHQVSWR